MLYNESNLDLSVALWLSVDTYEHDPSVISATQLLKPTKQIVLASRVRPEHKVGDVVNRVPSAIGTAIHDSIEKMWCNHYRTGLAELGYKRDIIDSIVMNPTPEEAKLLGDDEIAVYTERRVKKVLDGVTISGEYDFCAEGRVEDFKSTKTYAYQKGTKDNDYRLQGSIYRWLDPEVITRDEMAIQFIFTDWKQSLAIAGANNNYPQSPVIAHKIDLLSYEETEEWIRNKLAEVTACQDLPESEIPRCTDEELWRDKPVYKYYANPEKTDGRATKNFDSSIDADAWLRSKGKGIVIPAMGKVRACGYCDGFTACNQKDEYAAQGLLV